jgi:hypothetical protein
MREIFEDNMVFYTQAYITNTDKKSKTYNNVLVIKDDNFNDFLDIIDDEEEIEEIKFKLKRKKQKELKGITVIK